jgi:predicted  nucleic acid-binding Zn-ribbon protein
VLERELRKLNEENKNLKKEQRDRDTQLVESRKLIEKLSSSQKQLAS